MVPQRARIVIIGGGILGCSIAYWLTKYGESDVVLLEQHQLTDGATWHAAGLVGQLRSSRNTTRMLEQSVEMYRGLEAETGQAVDWHETGKAPDQIVATRYQMGKEAGKRLICAYPAVAVYKGMGPVDDPANFACNVVKP